MLVKYNAIAAEFKMRWSINNARPYLQKCDSFVDGTARASWIFSIMFIAFRNSGEVVNSIVIYGCTGIVVRGLIPDDYCRHSN
jgi:hypothetical protein